MSEVLDDPSLDRWGSQEAVADAAGISQSAVSKWVRKGVVKPRKSDGLYHVATAVAAIQAARDPDAALKGVAGGAAVSTSGDTPKELVQPTQLLKARTAAAVVNAQKSQLELQRLRGEVIARADVEAAIRTALTVVIERLEGLPGLLAARVQQATSVAAGEQIIRDAIRNVRAELAKVGEGFGDG